MKTSAVVIIAGSVVFLIAAFSPISRVFGLPSPDARLQLINSSLRAWSVSQVLFSVGAVVTAFGVILAASALRTRPGSPLLYVAGALLLVGSAAWSWSVYLRAINPGAFIHGTLPGWHFVVYTLLTMASFVLIGAALLRMGFPAWAGWLLLAASLLFFILYLIFKDMPPFVYYLLGAVLGVVLFRAG